MCHSGVLTSSWRLIHLVSPEFFSLPFISLLFFAYSPCDAMDVALSLFFNRSHVTVPDRVLHLSSPPLLFFFRISLCCALSQAIQFLSQNRAYPAARGHITLIVALWIDFFSLQDCLFFSRCAHIFPFSLVRTRAHSGSLMVWHPANLSPVILESPFDPPLSSSFPLSLFPPLFPLKTL